MTSLRLKPWDAICVFILSLFFLILSNRVFPSTFVDPDRYFHLALAKLQAGKLWLDALPQAEDVGWGKFFPDKEFLFHILTAWAYQLGGEPWVILLPRALSLGTLILLYTLARRWTPTWVAFGICTFGFLGSTSWVSRANFLRPHTLAILLFVWIAGALIWRNSKALFVGILLYTLSYHAVYIPGILIFAYLLSEGKEWKRSLSICYISLAAVGLGLLINPHFPGNIAMGWLHLKIALGFAKVPESFLGRELIPMRSDIFFKQNAFYLLVLVFALWQTARAPRSQGPERFLLIGSLLFWAMTFKSPRASEYATPLTVLLIASIVHTVPKSRFALVVALLAWTGLMGKDAVAYYLTKQSFGHQYDGIAHALEAIPPGETGKKIFNCNWDSSPRIFYHRPDLRFVDLLDPTFLLNSSSQLYELRYSIKDGLVPDPHLALTRVFDSDYVLCTQSPLVEQMETDPHFERLYPKLEAVPTDSYVLYRVSRTNRPEFITNLSGSLLTGLSEQEFLKINPSNSGTTHLPVENLSRSEKFPDRFYSDLTSRLKGNDSNVTCAVARAEPSEIKRLAGARWIGVGGGRQIRLWLNGKELFSSGSNPAPNAKLIQWMIPLPTPLSANDRLDIINCSSDQSQYLGMALSLWKDKTLQDFCDQRKVSASLTDNPREIAKWPNYGNWQKTCIGLLPPQMRSR